jgi:hypothetical protein
VCATSDVPPGVVNVLTGHRDELIEPLAGHRDIDAVSAANLEAAQHAALRMGTAENLKRVRAERLAPDDWYDASLCESPWRIEPYVEMKTIWHPGPAHPGSVSAPHSHSRIQDGTALSSAGKEPDPACRTGRRAAGRSRATACRRECTR